MSNDKNVKNCCWIPTDVAPLLAFAAVIATFAMFWYVIDVASIGMFQETKNLYIAQEKYNSSLLDLTVDKNSDEYKKHLSDLKDKVIEAKANLEALRESRTMVKDFVLYILGVLSSVVTTVFGYYFGSSRGNTKKDETISEIAKQSSNTE